MNLIDVDKVIPTGIFPFTKEPSLLWANIKMP